MAEIEFKIEKEIGVISEGSKGWKKELNMVSWNGRESKLDIREWDPTHQKMGKGLTMTKEEAARIVTLLTEYLSSS